MGAEFLDSGDVHVRAWAPMASRVEIVFGRDQRTQMLEPDGEGYFSGTLTAAAGEAYRFRLDGSSQLYPDPASRFQPDGPHGASRLVDPRRFSWTDEGWPGAILAGQIIYELHVGTFTREGTWEAASAQLAALSELGITTIEVMPIAEFDGRRGWGYDGVDLFAPYHGYGTPDDFRRFVDRAHAAGLAVILDVVYNHFGPSGNYLRAFSPAYFTDRYKTDWGDAINFDGPGSASVRELFVSNAAYWIDEFHLDGLRLDATQQIFDESAEHILAAIARSARGAAGGRSIFIVAENERQTARLVRAPEAGGYGLDALWNDDFHHSAMVALTGRAEAYYSDSRGDPQEFVSAAKRGYLFQGQRSHWQRNPRGHPALDVPPDRFVTFLQNHDQVANSGDGRRGHLLTSAAKWRAMTGFWLVMPGTPMFFQGQEFCASAPFLYFADFDETLNAAVRKGRRTFLEQFPSIADRRAAPELDDPGDAATFERCRLDFTERERQRQAYALHRDLLRLRRGTRVFATPRSGAVDGAVLAAHAFLLRFFGESGNDDRLVLVNLGADIKRKTIPEPLLAPPTGCRWELRWSSEDRAYGGSGTADVDHDGPWRLPAETTLVMAPASERHGRWFRAE